MQHPASASTKINAKLFSNNPFQAKRFCGGWCVQMRTQTTPDSAETVEILSAFLVITCNINNPACLFQLVKFGESCMNGNSVQRATKNSRFNNRGLHAINSSKSWCRKKRSAVRVEIRYSPCRGRSFLNNTHYLKPESLHHTMVAVILHPQWSVCARERNCSCELFKGGAIKGTFATLHHWCSHKSPLFCITSITVLHCFPWGFPLVLSFGALFHPAWNVHSLQLLW